ncbi:metal ABC transporter substrate-binding protein [Eubacterium ruminantium]|uniref:metal ABC transporter substrate-binding protein n=1 Tax=Eubacterium ruminantium TaxID=42322 RepID=UPI0023F39081|nr:metal ABC transporter substrate-binding protein [Eubacterium ruminantium]
MKKISDKKMLILKIVILILAAAEIILNVTACGKKSKDSGKVEIVCTIFPEYDWAKELVKGKEDKFNVTLLMGNGTDLHNFQPTSEDIMTISECDVFVYVGGESDTWVKDALKEAKNKNMKVIKLMDVLSGRVAEEETVEGMQDDDDHDDAHGDDGDDDHEDAHDHDEAHGDDTHEDAHDHDEYDEHVWLSVRNAKIIVEALAKEISSVDKAKDDADAINENLNEYLKKLDELDGKYKEAVAAGNKNTVIFGDRFPFRYLVDDYNLDYYAAFSGCSAETEASFETITFLAKKVDETGVNVVLMIDGSDESIARTIINSTNKKDKKILVMNSMQAVTKKDINAGSTYLDIMTENLGVLTEALK